MRIHADGQDISTLIESASWSGDENQMARKLSFTYLYTGKDPLVRPVDVTAGSRVQMADEQGAVLFDGIVVSEERAEAGITKSITAYDYAWYLKSKVHGTFKGQPAEITAQVCAKAGIMTGALYEAKASKEITIISTGDKTIYQVITEAYDAAAGEDGTESAKNYHVYMTGQTLCVEQYGATGAGTVTGDDAVTDASYKASIENMVNRVGILSGDKLVGEVTGLSPQYGTVQEYYKTEEGKDALTEASKLLKGIEQSGKITVIGNPAYVTGRSIIVQKAGSKIRGRFAIISDEHSFSDGSYSVSLGLRFDEIVA